ncbi:epithelial sodium channel subunit alpha-like [Babylonia areolata]|uniref:epithelial sodium channel subunit alpha-like n=1 Tax=Babylonia areolata TaxID=304850 RepID=UPI003FD5F813
MYAQEFDVGYSAKACRVTCYQMEVFSVCGCCDRDYPCYLTSATGTSMGAQYCNYSLNYDAFCVQTVQQDFQNDLLGCDNKCPPSCKETTFSTEVSTGRWPSNATARAFVKKLINHESASGGASGNIDIDYLRSNMAQLYIYFKQLNYEQIQTSPAYDWSRLLSDLGGQFGLWLGFSLLTALELVQLVFDVCQHLLGRLLWRGGGGKTGPAGSAVNLRH